MYYLANLISLATRPSESPSIFLDCSHEEERASADCLDWPRQFILSILNLLPRLDQKARRFRVRDWNMLQIQTCNGLPASFKRTIARLLEVVKCSKTKAKKSLKQSLIYVHDICNKSYMNCGNEMKVKKCSSQ